jgi:hypothetical protein
MNLTWIVRDVYVCGEETRTEGIASNRARLPWKGGGLSFQTSGLCADVLACRRSG